MNNAPRYYVRRGIVLCYNKTMTYIYNPGRAPQLYGHMTLAPQNYTAVTPEELDMLKKGQVPVLFEGDPDFPSPWVIFN